MEFISFFFTTLVSSRHRHESKTKLSHVSWTISLLSQEIYLTTFWMLHCMLQLRISTINIYIDRDAMQTHRSNRGYEYFSTLSLKWCHGSVAFFIFGAASQCLFHFRSKQKTSLSAPSEGSKKPLHPKRKLLKYCLFYI